MKNKKNKTLFIVAAGSGGHIIPAIVLGQQWLLANPTGKIIFIGSGGTLDAKILATHTCISQTISLPIDKFSIKKIWLYPKILFQVIRAFFKSFMHVFQHKPEKIICTGGLIALPVSIAARCAGIPVELYELNVEPGKAVRVLMPFASKIFITFLQSKKLCTFLGINFSKKCELVDYPIRFTESDKKCDKHQVFDRINKKIQERHENTHVPFSDTRKTIFILGGSQGSVFLNNLFKKFIEKNFAIANSIQVIHQAGSPSAYNPIDWPAFYATSGIPAITFSYDDQIKNYYVISDLIVCRAGAGTLFEIEFFQKPCLVIPLVAQTTDHQIANALAMSEKNPELFHVLTQDQVTKNFDLFSDTVLRMLVRND